MRSLRDKQVTEMSRHITHFSLMQGGPEQRGCLAEGAGWKASGYAPDPP